MQKAGSNIPNHDSLKILLLLKTLSVSVSGLNPVMGQHMTFNNNKEFKVIYTSLTVKSSLFHACYCTIIVQEI